MENKPQSVFEKLDKQEEKIEDISSKLEGISISDLYALAKRTWDYEDYQTAQKYYNHISLLRPLDWEAPLYASLCNFIEPHNMYFWDNGLERASKVLISSLDYINNLNHPIDEKDKEMAKCVDIVKEFMLSIKNMYLNNRGQFDNYAHDFAVKLETFYYEVFDKAMSIELDSLQSLRTFTADDILELIKVTNKLSTIISKKVFYKLEQISGKDYSGVYESIVDSYKIESIKDLSLEEKQKIKLNGIIYFEYDDKFVSRRKYNTNMLLGLFIVLLAVSGLILSIFSNRKWIIIYTFTLIYGVLLVIKALTQKERINRSSLLCCNRIKNRLKSDGTIIEESKFNYIWFIALLKMYFEIFAGVFTSIFALNLKDVSRIVIVFIIIINIMSIIVHFVSFREMNNERYYSSSGKCSYLYNGKFYNIE